MKGKLIRTFETPDGEASLEVRGEEPFLFGPQTLYFYANHGGNTLYLASYELHNDGATLRDDQIEVTWDGLYQVLVRLRGEEQAEEVLRFEF